MTASEEGNIPATNTSGTSVNKKVVAYGGGTGVGAALMILLEKIPDPVFKELATLAVPAAAIFISNVSATIFEKSKLSVADFRRKRYLKKKISEIEEALSNPLDDPALEAELKAALTIARRELILGSFIPSNKPSTLPSEE
ncbi:MAG: hypothetical protein OIF57_04665 [Marinobacterium sp.]|nr:hypothetical protein [Marinobacterium sp.]